MERARRRRADRDDDPRPHYDGCGESWHNNHHAFPTSAFHGLRPRELDLGGQFIRVLERLGLAWDVVRVSPERQQRRAASTATATPEPHCE
jgi:hypothetical protein